ncbi:MAG: nicotinate-nucleotide--dimethylbenzimidazole phosphoribosyltransferase [Filifactor alocis]|nr:nicotinate-nucleotide--dimethylbenzimidazole phosphoribosyltransferase [Filifactor alocis]
MDLLKKTISHIEAVDKSWMQKAKRRQDSLVKPPGSLGFLEELSIRLAGIYRDEKVALNKKMMLTFGADHGVYEEGISIQPQSITADHFASYSTGKCTIGLMAKYLNLDIVAVDVGIKCDHDIPGVLNKKIRKATSNMAKGAAMSREEAVLSIERGIALTQEYIDRGYEIFGIGEMGICNTTPSSAMLAVLEGLDVEQVTGLGAGTLPSNLNHKVEVIQRSIDLNNPDPKDPIDVLAKVGGFEIGAMAGVILGCSANRIPVVLDGFISNISALLATKLAPLSKDYMIGSHLSDEPGARYALKTLGLPSPLNMNMRLGEGSGGAMMFPIIDMALYLYDRMPTFSENEIPDFDQLTPPDIED